VTLAPLRVSVSTVVPAVPVMFPVGLIVHDAALAGADNSGRSFITPATSQPAAAVRATVRRARGRAALAWSA